LKSITAVCGKAGYIKRVTCVYLKTKQICTADFGTIMRSAALKFSQITCSLRPRAICETSGQQISVSPSTAVSPF